MKPTAARPPRELSAAHRKLWAELTTEYGICDLGGLEVLRSGLQSLAQAEVAEQIVAEDGAVQTDRFGQKRAHPLLAVARDFRAQWQAALKALNLDVQPAQPGPGRPAGR